MNRLIIRPLLLLVIVLLIPGCKIEIIVPSGGDVVSSNNAHNCSKGSVCELDILPDQLPFSESFTALPRPGYVFERWADGSAFLCAKSTNPTCTVNLADSVSGSTVVALFESGYIMPIFKDVGIDTDDDGVRNELDGDDDGDGIPDIDDSCPLTPDLSCDGGTKLTVNDKIWYQPDLFLGLTWEEVNAVCSGVICDGVLNGYNVTGWTWATDQEIMDLLAYYGTMNLGEECPDVYSFFQDGWRDTNTDFIYATRLGAWTKDSALLISPDIDPCLYDSGPVQIFGGAKLGAFIYMPN